MDINREHPEYMGRKGAWKTYRDLYAGGERMQENAAEYLPRRHREPVDVYLERLGRVFYENYIGSIVDWYVATLFRREPLLEFEGDDPGAKHFYSTFVDDCDRKGTALTDFLRSRLVETLVGGTSYVLVDFPKVNGLFGSRAAEDESGRSRAYLVGYPAEEVINWSFDEDGNYEWVVIRTEGVQQRNVTDREWKRTTTWRYFDKQRFQVYRREGAAYESSPAELISEGLHGLAKQNRVPLFRVEMQEGLWLLNKAGSLQLEHFAKSNALSWALTMGLFAMPVIYSERDFSQMMGESYYLQLAPTDRFGWIEPEGKVYQLAAENIERLKDEIYRVCYLTQMGGALTGNVQSGLSKMRDFSVTHEVLRAYGDAIKDLTKKFLRSIASAREDAVRVEVSGLDEFDIGDFSSELEDAERLLSMGIESETLKRQVFKKLALKFLCDARQELKDRIAGEIDSMFEKKEDR